MPIYTIAEYSVKPSGVAKVKQAIEEFVEYVRAHEPGTHLYAAWHEQDDPTRFVHFFIFDDRLAHFIDDGSRYRLGFDARDLLVFASGPISLPPVGSGEVVVRFADYRPTRGRLLPFRWDYRFAGQALAEERTLAACVDDPALTPRSFGSPDALPDCHAPEGQRPY